MVKLAEQTAELRLIGEVFSDSNCREPIQNAELLLPESLVDNQRVRVTLHSGGLCYQAGGVSRAQVRRGQHDIRTPLEGKRAEPATDCDCLPLSEIGKWDIDIADVDVDSGVAGFECSIARDISRGLTVAHDVQQVRPDLFWFVRFHAQKQVKERTSSGAPITAVGGANLVTRYCMRSLPDHHDPDWPRYPETILSFSTEPKVEIDLRELPSERVRAQLGAAGFGGPFAVVTAADPRGQDLSTADNEQRRRDLDQRLRVEGYRFAHVDACSPDRTHCECSVAVVMPQKRAIELARELEQVAIFWFDEKRFWIVGVMVDSDPIILPQSL